MIDAGRDLAARIDAWTRDPDTLPNETQCGSLILSQGLRCVPHAAHSRSDMADEHDRVEAGAERRQKKSYQAPRLVYYGTLSALTGAGSGQTVEGGNCMSMSQVMRPNPFCP